MKNMATVEEATRRGVEMCQGDYERLALDKRLWEAEVAGITITYVELRGTELMFIMRNR